VWLALFDIYAALLAVLGLEVQFTPAGVSGSLDELRRERGASP
jgi:hypothetical protein